jgi:hypothetical protein
MPDVRRHPHIGATLALAAAFGAALVAPPAAGARVVEMGETDNMPAASCPADCQVVGRVSGYQVRAAGVRNPFVAPKRGKIVAFSVVLGKPEPGEQENFFNDLFGEPPTVQLSILRPGTRRRHRLTGRSAVFEVKRYFGSTPTFALERPLTVRRGYVVALTTTSWAPIFAVGQTEGEVWRSSRDPERCDDVRQEAAQDVRGSLRTYGCVYRTARLLYTASFVPDPERTDRESTRRR